MIWKFPKRLNVRVHVERHGRLGMPEPTREFNGADALLVPKGGAPVSQGMWAEPTGVVHGGTDLVTAEAELDAIFESIRECVRDGHTPSAALTLAFFATNTNFGVTYVIGGKSKRFAYPQPAQLHNQHGQHEVVAEAGE